MTSILFLCSGGGGSLRYVYKLWKENLLPEISEINVIFDRECDAINWCKKKDLRYKLIKVYKDDQEALLKQSIIFNPSVIITNIFKILNNKFINQFKGKCINAHWSLLPSFAGKIGNNSIKSALEYKEKIIGSTIHFVSNDLDMGEPITQIVFGVNNDEDLKYHTNLMFKASSIALYTSLKKLLKEENNLKSSHTFKLGNVDMLISPFYKSPDLFNKKEFWEDIKYSK